METPVEFSIPILIADNGDGSCSLHPCSSHKDAIATIDADAERYYPSEDEPKMLKIRIIDGTKLEVEVYLLSIGRTWIEVKQDNH